MKPLKEEPLPVKIAYGTIFFILTVAILTPFMLDLVAAFPISKEIAETIVGTLVAAAAGTFGAQLVIERAKNKEMLLEEIRNTNAAIMLVFDTCSTFISLKKQQVKPLKEAYDKVRTDLLNLPSAPPGQPRTVHVPMDLRTFPTVFAATDAIQKQVFEKISVTGRPLVLTASIIRAVDSLGHSIRKRNELVNAFHTEPRGDQEAEEARMARYFGMSIGGRVDTHYPDSVEAIYLCTDDCIQFSKMLFEDLSAHGEELRKKFGDGAPKVHKPDFSLAEKAGLMPNPADYPDFYTAFSRAPGTPTP